MQNISFQNQMLHNQRAQNLWEHEKTVKRQNLELNYLKRQIAHISGTGRLE